MEYDLSHIHEACLVNRQDPAHLEQAFRFFHPEDEPHIPDRRALFLSFLRGLPSAEDQLKLRDRFHDIAQAHGARIREFRWWDIVQAPEVYLLALVIRDRIEIRVGFQWKESRKGTNPPMGGTNARSWGPDSRAPGGHSLLFESHTYQEVKAEFTAWHKEPLTFPATFKRPSL